jgi:hypothetical protein
MMSDGEAKYPREGVEEIKQFNKVQNLRFNTIGYGED